MFTGIVEATADCLGFSKNGSGYKLELSRPSTFDELQLGESIAVNGVCLTLVSFTTKVMTLDISIETFKRTTFSELKSASILNLERAMKLGGRFGGHIVTGHVDDRAEVKKNLSIGGYKILQFQFEEKWKKYLIYKGSVAVNGVSLTVNTIEKNFFEVSIIPHTLENTNLVNIRQGERVNLEFDLLGKYVESMLFNITKRDAELTLEKLRDFGFN